MCKRKKILNNENGKSFGEVIQFEFILSTKHTCAYGVRDTWPQFTLDTVARLQMHK